MKIEILLSHRVEDPESADQYFKLVYYDDWNIELIEFKRAGVGGGMFETQRIELTKASAMQLVLALQKIIF